VISWATLICFVGFLLAGRRVLVSHTISSWKRTRSQVMSSPAPSRHSSHHPLRGDSAP